MLGRTIQNYRLEEMLGEGGMGTVYKATDTLLQRQVAIKMLHQHLVRDEGFMARFYNEAILSAKLNHPNVATLYNFFQDKDDKIIIMELVEGITLEQMLRKQGPLPFETALRVMMQMLDGLQHAHTRNILHRDIKAGNIMITHEGTVKLMDFGIARLQGSSRLTRTDRVVGTLEYMAPELLNNQEPTVQSDLYACGVLLFEMLTGKTPFHSQTEPSLINQIINKKHPAVHESVSNLPKQIEQIIDRLLHKKADKRYNTALDLKNEFVKLVSPGPVLLQNAPKAEDKPKVMTMAAGRAQAIPLATRMAETFSKNSTSQIGHKIKEQLKTREAIILLAAILIAISIIGFWPATPKQQDLGRDGGIVNKDSLNPNNQQVVTLPADTLAPVNNPPNIQMQQVKEPEKEKDENYPPPPIITGESKKKISANEPVTIQKKEKKAEKKDPQKTEEKKEVEPEPEPEPEPEVKPVRKGELIDFRILLLMAELNQRVSSETSKAGQTVWFKTVEPVMVKGKTVIRSGAQIRGTIEKVISLKDAKRAGLWIKLEAVEAVDGQWIPVIFKLSDTSFKEVVFEKGHPVKRIRTAAGTVRA